MKAMVATTIAMQPQPKMPDKPYGPDGQEAPGNRPGHFEFRHPGQAA